MPVTELLSRKCLLFKAKNLSFSRFWLETAKLGLEPAAPKRKRADFINNLDLMQWAKNLCLVKRSLKGF